MKLSSTLHILCNIEVCSGVLEKNWIQCISACNWRLGWLEALTVNENNPGGHGCQNCPCWNRGFANTKCPRCTICKVTELQLE
jgi:hypothetical protein